MFTLFEYKREVLEYVSEVAHEYSESQAMWFVRELTEIGVRDEERNSAILPPFYSKQRIYQDYFGSRDSKLSPIIGVFTWD